MELSKEQDEQLSFYEAHYSPVVQSELVLKQSVRLADHTDAAARVCRFCGRGKPEVKFGMDAHAVPEFLGNKSIISMNECDDCNQFFGGGCEDNLAKWFGPVRAATQMKGKKNRIPTYKDKDIRIETGQKGLEIGIVSEDLESHLRFDGPFTFTIPVPMPSQPFVPLEAAKALVKAACSICPPDLLPECKPAIDWLMGRVQVKMSSFPVLIAFTPGNNPYRNGQLLLLKRKSAEKLPFLWCLLATGNYRFQFFVPLCPSDAWMVSDEVARFTTYHFPDVFGDKWPAGKTRFGVVDWASRDTQVREEKITFHVEKAEEVELKKPADSE